jgi:hypothetical protein
MNSNQFKAAHNSLKEMQNVMNIFENEEKQFCAV